MFEHDTERTRAGDRQFRRQVNRSAVKRIHLIELPMLRVHMNRSIINVDPARVITHTLPVHCACVMPCNELSRLLTVL